MSYFKTLFSCLLVLTTLAGLSAYTARVRCSRLCPCYYQSLFCKGYKYYNIPSDTSETIQNIDFSENRMMTLRNDTLARFQDLRKLLLGSNDISSIDDQAFQNQRLLNALDLSGNKISEIKLQVFDPIRKKLEHLTLQNNNLTRIEGTFMRMRILKTLNLKENAIKVITAETLYQNRKLRYIQLANNKLRYISPDSFKRQYELQYLFLDNNNLSTLAALKLPSKKLETLSLAHCNITVLPTGVSRSVRQINAAGNRIQNLTTNILSRLRNLESLDLSHNYISGTDYKTFRHSKLLKILYLSNNRLQEIPKRLPASLEQLTLDRNIISDVPKEVFAGNIRLVKLALNNNMIEFIHRKAFSGLSALQDLDLSDNVISRLSSETFSELLTLRTLDFSKNPLLHVEPGAFDGLWSLDTLHLTNLGNKLNLQISLLPNSPQLRILHLEDSESITKALFRYDLQMFHLRSVEYLYIRKDNLQTLQSTFPQYLPNLRRISLTENPWNCNRDLYWLKTWLINGMIEAPHLSHIFCDQPTRLRGRQIIDLDPYDWVM